MPNVCVSRSIYRRTNDGWAEGLITVFAPELAVAVDDKGETWDCRIEIEWPGFHCKKGHYGANAYQALELALRLVPSLIAATDDFKNRDLSLHAGDVVLDSTTIREMFHARLTGDV